MSRLVINPGTPQAWEIQLKPGANSFGRSDANDFKINDPSVSGSHCHILVSDGSALLRDAGSTNGTFIGGSRIQEGTLENGKDIKLGGVTMVFYSVTSAPATAVAPASPRVSVRIATRAEAPAVAEVIESPAITAITTETVPALLMGARFCKSHPKSPARFLCGKCNGAYCDLCILTKEAGGNTVRSCRRCGTEVVPYQFYQAPSKGFYAKLPDAFLYPFKGAGVLILICATIAFSALNFVSRGIFGLFISVALYGFVFLFMQNIILTTTSDENETLGFPDMSSLFGAAFQLAGTVVASFWLAIGLGIAKLSGMEIPSEAILGALVLGGIYFPMALLVVAMKDTVLAANPLVVIPAMVKVPAKYSVTVVLLLGVFGVRKLGSLISGGAGTVALRTHDQNTFLAAMGIQAGLALLSVYLLTVTMRILGLFYNSSKQKLGWFSH
ncbi:MAG TPA: FHA domain-containing protein [Candidatus Saccharimonadales bacterium]|nr:FHA domain-containing protein [Candidatus Saccharimonadales bacterium]